MIKNKIPVYLVTGFLGSGKTTFINQLLKYWQNKKVLVVENEIGEVNFDAGIISNAFLIQEISNGCLCCVLNEDWLECLEKIADSAPDIVLIEASGAADPANILAPFFQIPQIINHFSFQQTFGLVDTLNFDFSIEFSELTARQLALADTFIISRSEYSDNKAILNLKTKLNNLNNLARVFSQSLEDRKLDEIVKNPVFYQNKKIANINHETFESCMISVERPLNFLLFQNWINMIMKMSNNIYRIKGILSFQGFGNKIIFQAAGKYFSFEDCKNSDQFTENQMIWIGKKLQKEAIQKQVNKFQV